MRRLARTRRAPGARGCASMPRGLPVAPRRVEVDLSPKAMERIAAKVAQLLAESEHHGAPKLISAGELALRLGVERPWVYRHRHLLGGIRMGAGPKAPWRFEYGKAVAALQNCQGKQTISPQPENARRKS